jgi:hemolysin III
MDDRAQRPSMRGYSHEAAFFVALGAGSVLVALAPTTRAMLASLIYGITLALLFGISALYHRPWWPEKRRDVIARLDHAMIYLFIAGSNAPFSLLALPDNSGVPVMLALWTAAIVLAVARIVGKRMPRWLMSGGYVVLGWAAAVSVPDFIGTVGPVTFGLLLGGGIVYTVGAVIFWRKWPNPVPRHFGYHEVFHVLVIVGAISHFAAVARVVFAQH